MQSKPVPLVFNSVAKLHRALGLPSPQHPLISIANYADITTEVTELSKALVLHFYKISFKFNLKGKIRYGQHYYDFDEGGLSFTAPMQVISAAEDEVDYSGWTLLVHPDFLRSYPLARTIKEYGFFSYAVHEALFLSEQEKEMMIGLFTSIRRELSTSIDQFSQAIIISQIEQLLHYSNRFYNRQFITRKAVHHDLLSRFEQLLAAYFDRDAALLEGMLSIQQIADQLSVSQRYLSDLLRTFTGLNTQQYVQAKMIEKAKELLSTSTLTVAEIAYQLGFSYPQSFNKFFKKQTNMSPLDFRLSFNLTNDCLLTSEN